MRKGKTEKGITLIALILTIVILLILAIVAINSITNEGLLGKTENVIGAYNNSVINEQGTISGYEGFLGNYISGGNGSNDGETLVALYKAGKLKVGDYVDYKPSKNADGSSKTYKPDGETKGSLTGYKGGDLQVITQDDLNWRVLGYDSSKDELLLISGASTVNTITFYGVTGYNNYEDVLKDTCEALYSNTSIGAIARSITMDDIDAYLGGSAYDKTQYGGGNSSSGGYGYRKTSIGSFVSYDKKTDKLTRVDTAVTLDLTSNAYGFIASDVIKDATRLEILLGQSVASAPYSYWVAARFVAVGDWETSWCAADVNEGEVLANKNLCDTGTNEDGYTNCLRPVVSLKSNVTTKDVAIL